jgi:hypothetical protein
MEETKVEELTRLLQEKEKELQKERGAKAVLQKRLTVAEGQLRDREAALAALDTELKRERRKREELLEAAEQQLASLHALRPSDVGFEAPAPPPATAATDASASPPGTSPAGGRRRGSSLRARKADD